VRTEYEAFARTALVQLRRVREGAQLEEDHMRNRQAIVHWLLANTDALSVRVREGKTYHVLESVERFRAGVGEMLREVQRIKSEGDYASAKAIFETYGVHFDPELRNQIVRRVEALNLPSYTAFVMPTLTPVTNAGGQIVDVQISYCLDFATQMLEYSAERRARG
jgi:dipeptidyl-peptidase III